MTNPNNLPEITEDATAALSYALRDENEKSTKMIASLEEGTHTPEILIEGIEDILNNPAFKDLGLVLVASKDVLPASASDPSHTRRNLAALATVSALTLGIGTYVFNDSPSNTSTSAAPEAKVTQDETVLAQRGLMGFLAVESVKNNSSVKPNSVNPVKAPEVVVIQKPTSRQLSPRKRDTDVTQSAPAPVRPPEKPVAAPRNLPPSPSPTYSPRPITLGIPGKTYGPRPTSSPSPSPTKAPTYASSAPKPSPSPTKTTAPTTTAKPSPSPTRTVAR